MSLFHLAKGLMAVLIALTGAIGCEWENGPIHTISAKNGTSTTLTFELDLDNETYSLLGPLDPGVTAPIITASNYSVLIDEMGCTMGDVIARSDIGDEVARHVAGLCMGDTWVVEAP